VQLPIANSQVVLAYARVLMRQHRRPLVRMLSLYALAAIMALKVAVYLPRFIHH